MIVGCLEKGDHETLVFSILGEVRRTTNRTSTLDFRLANSGLFRRLIDKVSLEPVLEGKGVQEGWMCLKRSFLNIQKQTVPMCRKTIHQGTGLTLLIRKLRLEIRWIKYNLSSLEGKITWEDYKDVVRSRQEKLEG